MLRMTSIIPWYKPRCHGSNSQYKPTCHTLRTGFKLAVISSVTFGLVLNLFVWHSGLYFLEFWDVILSIQAQKSRFQYDGTVFGALMGAGVMEIVNLISFYIWNFMKCSNKQYNNNHCLYKVLSLFYINLSTCHYLGDFCLSNKSINLILPIFQYW